MGRLQANIYGGIEVSEIKHDTGPPLTTMHIVAMIGIAFLAPVTFSILTLIVVGTIIYCLEEFVLEEKIMSVAGRRRASTEKTPFIKRPRGVATIEAIVAILLASNLFDPILSEALSLVFVVAAVNFLRAFEKFENNRQPPLEEAEKKAA